MYSDSNWPYGCILLAFCLKKPSQKTINTTNPDRIQIENKPHSLPTLMILSSWAMKRLLENSQAWKAFIWDVPHILQNT